MLQDGTLLPAVIPCLAANSNARPCDTRSWKDIFMRPELQMIDAGAVRLRVAVQGKGPLIVLIHGFPESWYSWRHQIAALADAGYRVAAPDVRGYGGSDKPHAVEAYSIKDVCADIDGLITALGEDQAVVIGHDWGAAIAWGTAQFHRERVAAVAGLSVPHLGRGPMPSIKLFQQVYKDRFFYQLYFQDVGVAEAELEANIRTAFRKIYYTSSGDGHRANARIENPVGPGWLDRMTDPKELPAWLTEADLDYYVSQFRESGFR